MPIGVRAAKRGLPPIPAFGIGWLYPVCPRRANLAIPRPFFIPPDEVPPHNATDTKFPAQFSGNWLSVPGFAPRETLRLAVSPPKRLRTRKLKHAHLFQRW